MRVDEIRVRTLDGRAELSARVHSKALDEPFRLWFRFPGSLAPRLRPTGSAFLPAVLLPSMVLGEPVEIASPVSRPLVSQSRHVMDIYSTWWPELSVVHVDAEREPRPLWTGRRKPAMCFFSLGVDSFYTALKNLDGIVHGTEPIASLLFVAGFDVRVDDVGLLGDIEPNLREVAARTSTDMLWAETNLRDLTDPIVSWNQFHGSAMASVGIALERAFSAAYVASSYSCAHMPPWGSHPLTDALWSTPRIRFVHDGCEAMRPDKIASIVTEPVVRKTLRTCWENRGHAYNCGVCEKCLRTMASLEGLGVLPEMATFPDEFPFDALNTLDWTDANVIRRFNQILERLPSDPPTPRIREAIEAHLRSNGSADPSR